MARRIEKSVSRATVYRTLPLLVQSGLLHELDFGSDTKIYDPNFVEHPTHNHLICVDCDRIIEFEDTNMELLENCISRRLGFSPASKAVKIEGHCDELKLKGNLSQSSAAEIVTLMWKGRFRQATSSLLKSYSESVSFDWRLYRQDIRGSIAHARALRNAGILTTEEFESIESALSVIRDEIDAGRFVFDPELEDVHMNIEAELTRRIGDAGAKLHTARSRNDQVALDLRLYLRDEICRLCEGIAAFQKALVGLATRHADAVAPGYTHLQRAQPVFIAHHLLAYVEMAARDFGSLKGLRQAVRSNAPRCRRDRGLDDRPGSGGDRCASWGFPP